MRVYGQRLQLCQSHCSPHTFPQTLILRKARLLFRTLDAGPLQRLSEALHVTLDPLVAALLPLEVVVRALDVPVAQVHHLGDAFVEGPPPLQADVEVLIVAVQDLKGMHCANAVVAGDEGGDDALQVTDRAQLDRLVDVLFSELLEAAACVRKRAQRAVVVSEVLDDGQGQLIRQAVIYAAEEC